MAGQIVTIVNSKTKIKEFPRTVKSALYKDDGTLLNPVETSQIIDDLTTGGVEVPLSAQQGLVLDNKIGILSTLETVDKTNVVGAINENTSAIGQLAVQKDESKTTTFNPDGSITEVTLANGVTIRTKTTTFPSATQIVETTVENGVTTTKTTTFNADGTIKEEVV